MVEVCRGEKCAPQGVGGVVFLCWLVVAAAAALHVDGLHSSCLRAVCARPTAHTYTACKLVRPSG